MFCFINIFVYICYINVQKGWEESLRLHFHLPFQIEKFIEIQIKGKTW